MKKLEEYLMEQYIEGILDGINIANKQLERIQAPYRIKFPNKRDSIKIYKEIKHRRDKPQQQKKK